MPTKVRWSLLQGLAGQGQGLLGNLKGLQSQVALLAQMSPAWEAMRDVLRIQQQVEQEQRTKALLW